VVRIEVGRGEPQALAQPVAVHDVAVDREGPAEHLLRGGEVAELDRLADRRARDRPPAHQHLLDHLDLVAQAAQLLGRARARVPELAVEAQHEAPRTEAAHEHGRGELGRRHRAQALVEAEHERVRDPGAAEELEPVLEARQRARRAPEQELLGVIAEGDHRRPRAERARQRDVALQDLAVAQVHAVEDADADHRPVRAGRRQLGEGGADDQRVFAGADRL
jgi:hypothetical protein